VSRPTRRRAVSACLLGGWILAALVVVIGATGAFRAAGSGDVVARVGSITITATRLRPGPGETLTSRLSVTTRASDSDQLDAALAAGRGAVGLYHQRVSVGEISDLASCDGENPPPGLVDQWLHYGPMLVPGRSSGSAPPATATLTVAGAGPESKNPPVAVTLYFANAGPLTIDLPVQRV
jgi:hypothetical protein